MKKLFSTLSMVIVAAAMSLSAHNPQAPQPQLLPIDTAVRTGVLDNGLTYYIRHNSLPKDRCEFHIAQAVGATLEEDHQNGLAHFLEHMAFNGTKNFPGKLIINYFESVGVNFGGDINAYTSLEETVYRLSNVPTYREGILDSALLVMHDWSSEISLLGEEIDNERGVIREEWRTGAQAQRRMWKMVNPQKFPGSRFATRDVIGDTAVINNFSYQAIRDYYHQWYGPDLQCIVVVGDIDADKMEKKLIALFNKVPARATRGVRPAHPLPDNDAPIVARVTDKEAQNTRAEIQIKLGEMPKEFKLTDQGYMMYLIQNLFSTMFSYRFSELAQNPASATMGGYGYYGATAGAGPTEGLNFISVAKAGKDAASFKELATEVERFRRYGFTATEFERAVAETLSSYEKYYNERNNRQSQSLAQECYRHYLDGLPMPGIEIEYDIVKKTLPMLNVAVINQVCQPMITEKNVILAMTGSDKAGVVPSKEEILKMYNDVKASEIEAPKEEKIDRPLVENPPLAAGTIKKEKENKVFGTTEWMLSNGVKVVIKPTTFKNDEIRMYMHSVGGTSKIAAEDLISAELATGVVSYNGIGTFSVTDLQKVLAGKNVSVNPNISAYSESMSGSSTVKDFETMLQLSYLYFTAPRKDDEAYKNLMSIIATSLENKENDSKAIFNDSLSMTMTNMRNRVVLLNKENLAKANQERAIEIYKERFANIADFTVYFVGNINPNDVKTRELISLWFGGMETSKKKEKLSDIGERTPKNSVKNVFNRSMEIHTATNRIKYSAPMKYNLKNVLTMKIIGEILSTRYLEEIREKEGGSYGVGTWGTLSKYPVSEATVNMHFDTDPEKQEKLMQIIHREIDKIANEGPLDSDFTKTKEILAKGYKEDLEKNAYWMNMIASYNINNINNLEYLKVLESITPEYIQKTLKKVVDAGNVIEVVMLPEK